MKYRDESLDAKAALSAAGKKNCQFLSSGEWQDCFEDKVAFFLAEREYRIKPGYVAPVRGVDFTIPGLPTVPESSIPPMPTLMQGEYILPHLDWLHNRATDLVLEVLRLIRAGDVGKDSVEYCNQLTAILVELEEMPDWETIEKGAGI